MLAVRTIQKLNVPVLQAENGFEAMHLLMKHPETALIILDLIMPGQDGVKTFQEIRKMNESIPVIIVTGYPPDASEHGSDFSESGLFCLVVRSLPCCKTRKTPLHICTSAVETSLK